MPIVLVVLVLFVSSAWAGETPVVREGPVRAHLAFLADDLLEGRGTGQRGGDLAVKYLEAQLRALGLEPAAGEGYLQPAEVRGVRLDPGRRSLRFHKGDESWDPVFFEEVVYAAGNGAAEVAFAAPVLFVGYGIAAPAEGWDDFKGVDCRGKFLVALVNEPPVTEAEPGRFDGGHLTYFGRWTYKFEEAARRGAAGVLLIHTTEGASYDWSVARNGFQGEKFQLEAGPRGSPLQGWIAEPAARRLFAMGGAELDALRRKAASRDFLPIPLDLTARARLASAVRTFQQFNVAGILHGQDSALREEVVIYSAHWDHLGIQDGRIFNGAVDNAGACATLLAMAQASAGHPTARSQMFLFTFGEEQGLLGAKAYIDRPLWPLDKTVAALNLESLNWVGPARDIEFLGGRRSALLELGRETARDLGMTLMPEAPDRAGLYFRSDHFPFALAGIPALSPGFSLAGERDYLERPEASRTIARGFLERYHQEDDDFNPAWDLRGMVQQGQFILDLGRRIAGAAARPRWKVPPVPPEGPSPP